MGGVELWKKKCGSDGCELWGRGNRNTQGQRGGCTYLHLSLSVPPSGPLYMGKDLESG
jgi:hypothetical protein